MSYKVRTQAYSGPFDLLLQLVSRQKVDIGSISISEVADQYLAEVEGMGELDLDVASDFVLVAATLLDLKAASLVPEDYSRRRQKFLLEAEHVAPKRLPLALTVAAVDRMVRARSHVRFSELIDGPRTPENVVATFLAMLELAGRGSVTLEQEEPFGDIDVDHVEGAPVFVTDGFELSSVDEAAVGGEGAADRDGADGGAAAGSDAGTIPDTDTQPEGE